MPEALAHDWQQLSELIEATAERQDVPCRSGRIMPLSAWTDDDQGTQGLAAEACLHCPVIEACREYGVTHKKEAGVYGGLTEYQRKEATP